MDKPQSQEVLSQDLQQEGWQRRLRVRSGVANARLSRQNFEANLPSQPPKTAETVIEPVAIPQAVSGNVISLAAHREQQDQQPFVEQQQMLDHSRQSLEEIHESVA